MASYDGGTGWGAGLDWDMTSNQGLTPLVNYNFTLQVEGVYNLPCKSVHVFHRENEYETLQEGGLNDYVHMLRKPISKPMTFQVERYVGIDMFDPLALGTDLVLPVLLQVSRYPGNGEVLDLADSDTIQRVYTFTGCTVIAKDFGELNAERSGLLVETTTIAYREMLCIDNPSTRSKRKAWSMKKDHANMERDAEIKSAKLTNYGINERTKQELEERARMYVDKNVKDIPAHVYDYKGRKVTKIKVSDDRGIATKNEMAPISEREKAAKRFFMPGGKSLAGYKGASGRSAIVNKDELSREDMEKRARKGGANIPQMKAVEPRKGGANIPEMKTVEPRKGGANIPEMKAVEPRKGGANIPKMEPASGQRRYFMEGSKSMEDYKGKIERSAAVSSNEKHRAELEKNARMYFPKDSKGHKDYKGTRTYSALLIADEKRKGELEAAARKGGANIPQMKAVEPRKGGANIPQMKAVEPRKGGAVIQKMTPVKNQRRYFINGSVSLKSYSGTVKASAVTNTDELRKPAMQANARQWPKTRSAVDVAAFLKNKR